MLVALGQRNRNYRGQVSGKALPQAAMTLTFNSCILVFWRTSEERSGGDGTAFRDNFAALWASFLMAKELLAFFGRELTNRC
jgi:hypothetical protein